MPLTQNNRSDPSMADPVTHADLQDEIQRLRAAITLLANCMGAHLIDKATARRLMTLLTPPHERHEVGHSDE